MVNVSRDYRHANYDDDDGRDTGGYYRHGGSGEARQLHDVGSKLPGLAYL